MLASITPLGERARKNSWWLTVSAYGLASTAGGATIGAVAGSVGLVVAALSPPAPGWRAGVGAAVCLLAAAADLAGLSFGPHRQVDRRWLDRYRGWVYGGGFGFQLGLGVVTIVNSASVFAMLGLAVLLESPAAGAVAGAAFGLVRALPVLAFHGAGDFSRLQRAHQRLRSVTRASRIGTVVALGLATAVLAGTSLLA